MDRAKHIQEIIESLRQGQRATCGRLAKVPGMAVTPAEWALLNLLYHTGGTSVKELSRTMSITGSAITQLANSLARKNYIKRETDKNDKRATLLLPTAKCNKMIGAIQKSFAEECASLFAKLSDAELRTLSKLHKKIAASFAKPEAKNK